MEEKIEKIVVKSEDELIDIVREISKSAEKKILVSFVEDSEILISSINLKVLLDSGDEKEALLILQIPSNPSGIRNAKLAGIPTITSPSLPTQEVWEDAQEKYMERRNKTSKATEKLPQDYKSENITSFEDKINSVLDRNKEEKGGAKNVEIKEKGDSGIVIDQDISKTPEDNTDHQDDLTRIDFKNAPNSVVPKKSSGLNSVFLNIKKSLNSIFKRKKSNTQKPTRKPDPIKKNPKNRKEKILRLLPKIFIPLVVVLFLFFFMYYKLAPYVRVTIFIESKPVEVEKTFTGNENINEINFESLEIPVKKETVTKSVSDTVAATGSAFRGEKATGNVTISYINPGGCPVGEETLSLSQGHQISTDGKSYLLTGDLTTPCNDYSVVGVEAVEVGEEYNISSGNYFSVNGYDSTTVFGTNSAALTGGSKQEYTVLSQNDVNTKVEELTEIAKDEAESSLTDIGNGWEIIESTINTKVKEGSIKSAVAIGTETSSSDVSLEVESSATYYYTVGVDDGLNDLLTEAALNQNLFESDEGLDLTLTGDIQKDLVVSEKAGKVEIVLTASSSVEPSVSKEDLIEDLEGTTWTEGREYLNSLTFTSDKDPVVVFEPENFPQKLRHFPSRQGRIQIAVKKESIEE